MLPKSCNIILFGPSGAGKSSLIKYYKYIYIQVRYWLPWITRKIFQIKLKIN